MASYFSASPAETFFARIYRRVSSKLVRYLRVKVHIPTVSRVSNVNITVAWILVSLPSRFNRKKLESNFVVSHLLCCCCCCCCFVVVPGWTEELPVQPRSSEQRLRGRERLQATTSLFLSSSSGRRRSSSSPTRRSVGWRQPSVLRVSSCRARPVFLSLSHPRNLLVRFSPFSHLDPLLDRTNRFDRLRSDNRIKKFSVFLFVRDSQQSRAMHGVIGAVTRRSPGSR